MQPEIPKASNQEPRTGYFPLIMGTNGTGKTTLLKEFVANEMRKSDSHVLILTAHVEEWLKVPEVHPQFMQRMERYTGIRKIIITRSTIETVLSEILAHFRKGLLIFDDCRMFFKSTTLPLLEDLMISRRMMMIDCIAVGHGPEKIPPAFFAYASHIIMFKTNTSVRKRKNELDNIARWETIQQSVNNEAIINQHYYEIHQI